MAIFGRADNRQWPQRKFKFRQQCQWIQRFLTSLVFSSILLLSPVILLANVSKPLSTASATGMGKGGLAQNTERSGHKNSPSVTQRSRADIVASVRQMRTPLFFGRPVSAMCRGVGRFQTPSFRVGEVFRQRAIFRESGAELCGN